MMHELQPVPSTASTDSVVITKSLQAPANVPYPQQLANALPGYWSMDYLQPFPPGQTCTAPPLVTNNMLQGQASYFIDMSAQPPDLSGWMSDVQGFFMTLSVNGFCSNPSAAYQKVVSVGSSYMTGPQAPTNHLKIPITYTTNEPLGLCSISFMDQGTQRFYGLIFYEENNMNSTSCWQGCFGSSRPLRTNVTASST